MQNLVSKTRDAIDVNALGPGAGIVEHHDQSAIALTEAASHLPLQYTTTDHEEQKGRLKRHIEFWQNLGAPDFVLSVIQEGYNYKIPFIEEPPIAYLRNNQSALGRKDLCNT